MTKAQTIAAHVVETAMHILHESYLYGSDMWPKNGFRTGRVVDTRLKNYVLYGVNPYNCESVPAIGRICFEFKNTGARKEKLQGKHLKIIMDQAYRNGLFFEDESKSPMTADTYWFQYTYTPTK
jgi:hypothetical protein